MKLKGSVSNGADGVHIYTNSDPETVHVLAHRVRIEAPALARIQSVEIAIVEPIDFWDFTIVESQMNGPASLLLTPDLALCDACRAEMNDPTNRRSGYAFTTCTHCGPRYSILRQLPYDRPTTTMVPFALCADCEREYHDPADRRFYAQTNSCPNCPIEICVYEASGRQLEASQAVLLRTLTSSLRGGCIVAVKGIGGFLLLCDATNVEAIHQLRQRKHRPTKPLAILYPGIDQLQQDCYLADDEQALLMSPASPIVVLDKRPQLPSGLVADQIAPGLHQIGVMLPYAPLLALLAGAFGKPLVATSGNSSGSPICYTNEQAMDQLPAVADLLLTHNREIVVPQDDSVVRLSPTYRQPIILRRSRGLAPTVMLSDFTQTTANVLALGASLKSTFAWQLRGNTYVSQYLGDLESYDTQTNFRATLDHFLTLFNATPDAVLADQHEGYFSTQLAHELAATWGVPLIAIQHHEAHLAAVLAENRLMEQAGPVLGVIWDGTGYGTDGQIWGGEFIKFEDGAFERVGHFAYFDALLGDKMPREPRLSALSLAFNVPGAAELLRLKFSEKEWNLYAKLPELVNGSGGGSRLKTSSVGRLFDAVAALLGLADKVSYEGEAALLLENAAARYIRMNGYPIGKSYLPGTLLTTQIPTQFIVAAVVNDLQAGLPVDQIAALFHYTLVQAVAAVARQTGSRQLAFSGGVFQNALLVDWLRHALEPAHQLYFHQQLSPNDECISFGQIAQYALITKNTVHVKPETAHVLSHSR
ncbi:carbamoyltransferase HypF [Spirosoma pulveris]